MEKLYGLIFDVDGVVADTESINARATAEAFAELFDIHDMKRSDFESGLGRGAEQYVIAGAGAHGLMLNKIQLSNAVALRQENFFKILSKEPLAPFPGVLELINVAMVDDAVETAIATSSTPEKSRAVLDAAGIPYKKMTYITGADVKNKKPDPELFLLAAEGLELNPARCAVIEDAPNGVAAAKAAGAKCIAVTNSISRENLAAADIICDSLEQLDLQKIKDLIDQF